MHTLSFDLSQSTLPGRIKASLVAVLVSAVLVGCGGTCCVITKFETEPQWVCPGQDFAAKVHFRLENFDKDGNPSDGGRTLWNLWNTTTAAWNQPGAISLSNKVGTLNRPRPGIHETPAAGVFVLSSSQAQNFELTLTATNLDCDPKAEDYLRSHQAQLEQMFGLDLDDSQAMTARTRIEVISSPANRAICVPHVIDPQGGIFWVTEEKRAGPGIVIDGIRNVGDVPLLVSHASKPAKLVAPQRTSRDFDGASPNGRWEVGVAPGDRAAYDVYVDHGLEHVGKRPICIEIGLRCE